MESRLLGSWSYSHSILMVCSFAYFASRIGQLLISPVVPVIATTFEVSNGAFGVAFSIMWTAYALTQLPSGALADRFGERRTVLAALGAGATSCLLLAAAPTFLLFIAFAGLLGASTGLYYNAAVAMLARYFDRIGSAIGLHRIGSMLAGLIAPAAGAAIGVVFGWRWALGLGGGIALVGFVIVWAGVRPTSVTSASSKRTLGTWFSSGRLLNVLTQDSIAYTTALTAIGEFVGQATMSFLPVFLVTYHSLSIGKAGLLFSVFFVISGLAQPIMGWFSDRTSRQSAVQISTLAGTFAYWLLVVGEEWAVILTAIGLAGFSMSRMVPLQSRIMNRLDSTERGVGFGAVRTVYLLLGAMGSMVTGALAELFGWNAAFLMLGGLLAAVFVAIAANRLLDIGL